MTAIVRSQTYQDLQCSMMMCLLAEDEAFAFFATGSTTTASSTSSSAALTLRFLPGIIVADLLLLRCDKIMMQMTRSS